MGFAEKSQSFVGQVHLWLHPFMGTYQPATVIDAEWRYDLWDPNEKQYGAYAGLLKFKDGTLTPCILKSPALRGES